MACNINRPTCHKHQITVRINLCFHFMETVRCEYRGDCNFILDPCIILVERKSNCSYIVMQFLLLKMEIWNYQLTKLH